MTPREVLAVPCPRCHAEIGDRCRVIRHDSGGCRVIIGIDHLDALGELLQAERRQDPENAP